MTSHPAPPNTPTQPPNQQLEQGYTLQTLIVTAVVVLLAVAAGVVIVAITRSSSDDLIGTQPKIDGPCEPWEIHDIELEAAGAGGGEPSLHVQSETTSYQPSGSPGTGGYTSSAIGCLAPCYLVLNDIYDALIDLAIQKTNEYLTQKAQSDHAWRAITGIALTPDGPIPLDTSGFFHSYQQGNLKYDTTNRRPRYFAWEQPQGDGIFEVRVGVVHEISPNSISEFKVDTYVGSDYDVGASRFIENVTATGVVWHRTVLVMLNNEPTNTPLGTPLGLADPPFSKDANMAIRAVAEAQACDVYDTVTNEVLASSTESRVGRIIT